MPDEPPAPHPLEAALRAQADRRRAELGAGRPPELPGPVRAALRREVARGASPVRDERTASVPWWWRWQTLLAASACLVLAVAIFRRDPSPTTSSSAPSAPPAPAATKEQRQDAAPSSVPLADRERAPAPEPANARDADRAVVPPPAAPVIAAPAPVVPPPLAGSAEGKLAEQPSPSADELQARSSVSGENRSPSETPAVRLEQPSLEKQLAGQAGSPADARFGAAKPAAAASQRFLQTPRQQTLRSAQAVASSPVLTDFTLRREGDTLVIREGDGSEYRAPLAVAAGKAERDGTDAAKKDALMRRAAPGGAMAGGEQSVSFRATGVNQTLKQTVVVEGILRQAPAANALDAVPAPARSKTAASPAAGAPMPAKEAASRAATPARASIQGRAIISGREYAVEAEETGPPPAGR